LRKSWVLVQAAMPVNFVYHTVMTFEYTAPCTFPARRPAFGSVVEEDVDKSPLKLNLVGKTLGRMIEIHVFGLEIPLGWMLGWTLESAPPGRVLCVPGTTRTFGWLAGVQLFFCGADISGGHFGEM
jgi:hypothetical protein